MAISYTVRNNADTPPDTQSTDSFTAINLTYTFGNPELEIAE